MEIASLFFARDYEIVGSREDQPSVTWESPKVGAAAWDPRQVQGPPPSGGRKERPEKAEFEKGSGVCAPSNVMALKQSSSQEEQTDSLTGLLPISWGGGALSVPSENAKVQQGKKKNKKTPKPHSNLSLAHQGTGH